jgi:uncharacterized protein YvpB
MKGVHLDLPRYKNFNNYSCFVTTIAMVLEYYGKRINQRKIFEKAKVYDPDDKKRCIGSTVPSVMLALKNEGYKMIAWHDKDMNEIKKLGKNTEEFYKIWDKQIKEAEKLGILESHEKGKFSYIKKFLDKGIPVIVGVKSKIFYEGNPAWENSIYNKKWPETTSHVVVLTGYIRDKYIFNDSSPFLKGNEGKDRIISGTRLKKAWESVNDVKNAIFVLEKIK